MSSSGRILAYIAVAACLVLVMRALAPRAPAPARADAGALYRLDAASAKRAGVPLLDAGARAATFTFGAGTTNAAKRIFLGAVAGTRPEARRLVALVDGLVTVRFEHVALPKVVGLTRFDGERFEVTVDLDRLVARYGLRDAGATILHELGHVVDRALVPDELAAELDAAIPTGERCAEGQPTGACASVPERFADTFAKWALDDLGVNGTVGYRILPPVPIAAWGAPLAQLGAAG